MLKIDSHHHFWHYNTADYGWISDEMALLRRDFLPEDLAKEISAAGIDRVISVQARQILAETDWLLELAGQHDFISGVVGWLPLADPHIGELLEKYAQNPKLKAVRHVVQDEADDRFILGDAFNAGVSRLKEYHLTYDILVFERHLPYVIDFVDRHAGDQIFVLDHIAKPQIKAHRMEPWAKNLAELARRQNVFCKLSGVVTEADLKRWQPEDLLPYMETVLAAFGSQRLLFGSDWPVCTSAFSYLGWTRFVEKFIAELSPDEKNDIMGNNARKAYRL